VSATPGPAVTPGPVLVLTGPTSSGKTALSIPVAQRLNGEIISMDSRQLYRGMDIGTDKVKGPERDAVPHHGLDLVDPDERFSAGRWARAARGWIEEIRARGRLPVLVGGTGFYLKALLEPVFQEPPMDPERRDRLRNWLAGRSTAELGRWVDRLDPGRAALARDGGPQRLARTLEVALLTGRPLSEWHELAPPEAAPVEARVVVLTLPRELLYGRINARAERMFREGLLDEVRGLLAAGFGPDDPGMTGTGYREAAAVLAGEISIDEALDRIRRVTRGYARRQLTWFRGQLGGVEVMELNATLSPEERVESVVRWWRGTAEEGHGYPERSTGTAAHHAPRENT